MCRYEDNLIGEAGKIDRPERAIELDVSETGGYTQNGGEVLNEFGLQMLKIVPDRNSGAEAA